ASKGGEFWLTATLPRLQNTVAILAGRELTLFGEPVHLYETLKQRMPVHTITVQGIPPDDERRFIIDQRDRLAAADKPEDIRELARSIEFDEQTFAVWHAISDGIPFWDSMLLTSAMLGAIPSEVDQLREKVFAGQPIDDSPGQRRTIRAALMREILAQGVRASDQQLILVLQWMAFIRKGATPAILHAIAHDQAFDIDVQNAYDRLGHLDIVKTRRSPYAHPADPRAEDMLFLHDEIYHWLDQDAPTQGLREISAAVMRFYDQEIAESERRRVADNDRLIELGQRHPQAPALRDRIREELRLRQQLELDRLGYSYQSDLALGTPAYNLLSYGAILDRDVGYSITLRQEGLRNMYRLHGGVTPEIVVECAARWVLRAVHTDDADAMELVAKLPFYYEQEADHPGLHYALLYLADAQARTYFAKGSERATVLERLRRAEAIVVAHERGYRTRNGDSTDPWSDFLLAQIHNWRGFYYREEYRLPEAIEEYRRALSLHLRQPNLLRLFLGSTLNNLAYAYSEQGEIDEARRFGQQALAILQR
ncbi:MAG TPA: tetratricopeptide repeat protein, partial [Roseiflexaceae bacterium]